MGLAKYKVYVERIGKDSDIIKLFEDYDAALRYAKHQPIGYSYVYELNGFKQTLIFQKENNKKRV